MAVNKPLKHHKNQLYKYLLTYFCFLLLIVPITNVNAVQSSITHMPCNVTAPTDDDKFTLVIWYKDGLISPVYRYIRFRICTWIMKYSKVILSSISFDARDSVIDTASRWSDPSTFHDRGTFEPNKVPAMLEIKSVRNSDTGVYRCRVDFQKNPTRNSKVNLTVISEYDSLPITYIFCYKIIKWIFIRMASKPRKPIFCSVILNIWMLWLIWNYLLNNNGVQSDFVRGKQNVLWMKCNQLCGKFDSRAIFVTTPVCSQQIICNMHDQLTCLCFCAFYNWIKFI